MSSKRLVVTTSTSCLDYYEHDYDIRTIRIKIDIDGKLYADGTEMRAEEFYDFLTKNPDVVPKTSQPSIGELLEMFEGFYAEGFDEIITTTISSKLSGTYNGIVQCANILADKMKIIPYDTKTVCFNEGVFALRAAELFAAGVPTEEVLSKLDYLRDHNKIMFAVDSLEYLVKNGRLSGAAGFFGKYLKIKPLLEVVENGTIQAVEKIRTTKKALEGVCERLNEYVAGHDYFAYIVYTGDALKPFLEETLAEVSHIEGLMSNPCTPIVGCHVGPNAIGIGVFLKD